MELLIVIGITAILFVLGLQVMGRLRMQSDTVQCLSNLKQIGAGFEGYKADHRLYLPQQPEVLNGADPKQTWWGAIAPYINWPEPLVMGPNAAKGTIGHCPAHTEHPGSFSYYASLFMITAPGTPPVSMPAVVHPHKKVILWEVHTLSWWPLVSLPGPGTGKAPFIPAYTYPAHGHNTNHLYADGHVESRRDDPSYWHWFNWQPYYDGSHP